MVITGQVLSVISRRCNISMIISSLSAKKIQSEFWTNKPTCLMFHSKWEQVSSQ